IHTLIVGAGPSGLATAHKLTQAGIVPLIVERSATAGGLMRSIARGDFTLDIGRKELYTRIPEVDRFWREILRDDYREYPHRVGSLYRGHILELSGKYRGPLRGLPLPWLIWGGLDLVRCWLGTTLSKPTTYQDYWYRRAGRRFARMFAQGYWEKFRGETWADMPVPDAKGAGHADSYSFNAIRQGLKLASQGGPSSQTRWRHPAKGSGQISDRMLDQLRRKGVSVAFETEVISIKAIDGTVAEVTTRSDVGLDNHYPRHVVSSMRIEDLVNLLTDTSRPRTKPAKPPGDVEQSVVLVYLFLDEPCRFPHAWLEVNDTELRSGRITNYAAFNGDMVPEGKACLCVEFFCVGDNPIMRLSAPEIAALAIRECVDNKLIDPTKLVDTFATTMKRTNAAASWRDWHKAFKLQLLSEVSRVENLFHVNRPGMDWATFAGMVAAESILEGCRSGFDRRADPTRKYQADPSIEDAKGAAATQG
ncbi:MAG: NAD(P)-binding protein, partial [Geminicoccaceae bacterium]